MQPPETVSGLSPSKDTLVQEYTSQLSDLQKKTMNIAQEHLGLSFNIVKSVGFQEYLSRREPRFPSKKN